jgi:hypothetical protein
MFKEDTNKFYRNLGLKTTQATEPPLWQKSLTGSHCGEKKYRIMRQQNG